MKALLIFFCGEVVNPPSLPRCVFLTCECFRLLVGLLVQRNGDSRQQSRRVLLNDYDKKSLLSRTNLLEGALRLLRDLVHGHGHARAERVHLLPLEGQLTVQHGAPSLGALR